MNQQHNNGNMPNLTGECNCLAMATVPLQVWQSTYPADVALKKGTIFPELDLPFLGKEVIHG